MDTDWNDVVRVLGILVMIAFVGLTLYWQTKQRNGSNAFLKSFDQWTPKLLVDYNHLDLGHLPVVAVFSLHLDYVKPLGRKKQLSEQREQIQLRLNELNGQIFGVSSNQLCANAIRSREGSWIVDIAAVVTITAALSTFVAHYGAFKTGLAKIREDLHPSSPDTPSPVTKVEFTMLSEEDTRTIFDEVGARLLGHDGP